MAFDLSRGGGPAPPRTPVPSTESRQERPEAPIWRQAPGSRLARTQAPNNLRVSPSGQGVWISRHPHGLSTWKPWRGPPRAARFPVARPPPSTGRAGASGRAAVKSVGRLVSHSEITSSGRSTYTTESGQCCRTPPHPTPGDDYQTFPGTSAGLGRATKLPLSPRFLIWAGNTTSPVVSTLPGALWG